MGCEFCAPGHVDPPPGRVKCRNPSLAFPRQHFINQRNRLLIGRTEDGLLYEVALGRNRQGDDGNKNSRPQHNSCNLSHTLTSEVRDKQGLTGSCSAPSALRACSRGGNTYQSSLTLKHHRKVLNYTCVTSGVWWGAMQCDKYSYAQLGRAHLAGADGNGMLHAVCIAPHDGYMSISKGD